MNQKLDFVGEILCPMKNAFSEGYQKVAAKHFKETGERWYSYVPTVCHGGEEEEAKALEESLRNIDIETFPEVVASFGFKDYFHSAFRETLLGKGYFEGIKREGINGAYKDIAVDDPNNEIHLYGGLPITFLIDKRRLGNLPVPKTLEDLLDPIYKDNITTSGSHGRVSPTILLYIYKEFGEDGLRRYEHNVSQAMHPSQMAKVAGTSRSDTTAIYTINNFFGRAKGDMPGTDLIWPEDGACIDPAFVLIKKGASQAYKDLIDYVTCGEFAKTFANNGFPVVDSKVTEGLERDKPVKWLGWDFIKDHQLELMTQELSERFKQYILQ